MRIGVTGAFGFLGANFVAELLARGGCEIVAFASRTRSNPLFDTARVETAGLDVLDEAGMSRAFAGLDAVAHFAGKVDYRASERRAVWDADAVGAKRLFDAVLAARVPRLLYLSSVNVLGASLPGALADESRSPYGDPSWPISFASPTEALAALELSLAGDYRFLARSRVAYFDAKLAAYELAKRYAKERGLPVVTVMPGTAVGAGDLHRAISSLVDGAWDGGLSVSVGGATSFVAARDFAAGARLALERGKIGEAYAISGRDEDNLEYPEFISLVGGIARDRGGKGCGRPLVLPRPIALSASSLAERLAPRLGLARALIVAGSARNVCSSAKARAELGYEPGDDLVRAIVECREFSEARRAARRSA